MDEELKNELFLLDAAIEDLFLGEGYRESRKQAQIVVINEVKSVGKTDFVKSLVPFVRLKNKEWILAIPEFLKLFGSRVDESQELQRLKAYWDFSQSICWKFKKRDEIMQILASKKPLDSKSPFVTFLLCVQRFGFNKLLRNILPKIYSFYIASEFEGFEIKRCPALQRVADGGKWLLEPSASIRVERLECLDPKCNSQFDQTVRLSVCFVKSLYLKWLHEHFLETHGCSWEDHASRAFTCKHEKYHEKILEAYDLFMSKSVVCKTCGKVLDVNNDNDLFK